MLLRKYIFNKKREWEQENSEPKTCRKVNSGKSSDKKKTCSEQRFFHFVNH